jgi:beta-galactosidase GanA
LIIWSTYTPMVPDSHIVQTVPITGAYLEKLARYFKDHPGLVMWHINNEYGCHVEKYHSAMVTHTGNENSRIFREVAGLGEELKTPGEIADSRIYPDVAVLFDFDNWWAVEYDSLPSKEVKYLEQVKNYHHVLFNLNISSEYFYGYNKSGF